MITPCRQCQTDFEVTAEDKEFYQKVSPIFKGISYHLPSPTFCPECRAQRRLAFRNERKFYTRQCALCTKDIISIHRTTNPVTVYCQRCWWSDRWDPLSYGRDFDFSRPFFEQFEDLYQTVPQIALMNDNGVASENCEYTQDFAFGKNCYLAIASWKVKDCMYCDAVYNSADIVDSTNIVSGSELVYESIHSLNLYSCAFLALSENCSNCWFGLDLKGCKDCFCCFGLRQKQYCIFNQPYSESEYKEKVQTFDTGSYQGLETIKAQFTEWLKQFPKKYLHMSNCEESLGDNLINCKNTFSFDLLKAEHCKYYVRGEDAQWCYDIHQSGCLQWCYEGITPDNAYMALFTLWCWKSKFTLYSDNCHSSEHVFGCTGLKRGNYCILNKQYTKEAYEELAARIIQHMKSTNEWGEFFPISLSPFPYNDTLAQEHYPLTQEVAKKRAIRFEEEPLKESIESISNDLPDNIKNIPDSIFKETLSCLTCNKNYRLIEQELAFYRKMQLPIPRKCFHCRHFERLKRQNPRQLFARNCSECDISLMTTYPLVREPKVLCEPCYNKRVY
ncbi:MAG: hypothetical protein HY817_05425 [Candidatus Abawacabacteria bacterium]|nr:hypothetical protein [Candidatus Abawacabacteria bacterium]